MTVVTMLLEQYCETEKLRKCTSKGKVVETVPVVAHLIAQGARRRSTGTVTSGSCQHNECHMVIQRKVMCE